MLNCLDHFAVDPAITPVRATDIQLVTLCRSVYAEERSQILDPVMGIKCPTMCCYSFQVSSLHCIFLFTELDAVPQQLGHSAARPDPHVAETSDLSADKSRSRVPGWTAIIDMSSQTSGVALYPLLLLLIVIYQHCETVSPLLFVD